MNNKVHIATGLMSGTSLDGLDIVMATFYEDEKGWSFTIEKSVTISYDPALKSRLAGAMEMSGTELVKLDHDFSIFCAEQVNDFLKGSAKKTTLLASHGHTVFHCPEEGITHQVGSGAVLAAITGLPVVCDFRSGDVALGGQGAPLVPAGDHYLFSEYDECLNLGGFANVSGIKEGKRVAWDICGCNLLLNRLAGERGKEFDRDGAIASRGKLLPGLLEKLEALPYFKKSFPKSLGREWIEKEVWPIIHSGQSTCEDKMHTVAEHIAKRIAADLKGRKVLCTGGGAHNTYLVERIRALSDCEITIPGKQVTDFKEALIFAFLGVLRMENRINVFSSVTGAIHDSVSGAVYLPAEKK